MADASIAVKEKFFVYIHSRLNTGEPFYVGKGRLGRVTTRFGRSAHWNRIVSKDGGRYVNAILETHDEELAFLVEIELIDKYRRMGVELINKTCGGEGMSGYRMTPEQIANQSRAKMGNKANLGRKDSEETRARKRAAQRARTVWPKLTEEHKRKIGLSCTGKKFPNRPPASAETRAKLSAFQKARPRASGYKLMDEHKAKIADAHKNRTQEERDKISKKLSASTKLIWEKRKLNK